MVTSASFTLGGAQGHSTPVEGWGLTEGNGPEDSVVVGGVTVTRKTRQELTDLIVRTTLEEGTASRPAPWLLFDLNGHALGLRQSDPDYAACLKEADIVHVDSEPLVMASRWLTRTPVRERSATTDIFHDFSEAFEQHEISCFFLGGNPGVVTLCVERMQKLYPKLKIAGWHHGYFDAGALPNVMATINASKADILWVGMGKPREQRLALQARDLFSGKWIVTCGGCFDFASGCSRRAPLFMQKAGLEWLHRLLHNPRKLFWRYFTTNPIAVYAAMRHTRAIASTSSRHETQPKGGPSN